MTNWSIERTWTCPVKKGDDKTRRSAELCSMNAVCLLGSAGLGKTFEMDQMAEIERASGRTVRASRLAMLGFRENGLRAGLNQLSADATAETTIYLDALDEAMVPFRCDRIAGS